MGKQANNVHRRVTLVDRLALTYYSLTMLCAADLMG